MKITEQPQKRWLQLGRSAVRSHYYQQNTSLSPRAPDIHKLRQCLNKLLLLRGLLDDKVYKIKYDFMRCAFIKSWI